MITPQELRNLAESFANREMDTCNDDDSNRLYEALRGAANEMERRVTDDDVLKACMHYYNSGHRVYAPSYEAMRFALEKVWPLPPNNQIQRAP